MVTKSILLLPDPLYDLPQTHLVLLEAAADLDILPDNFKEIFPLMREEIDSLKKQISTNETTYSWKLFECEDNKDCMENIVKQFLKHLFKLEL